MEFPYSHVEISCFWTSNYLVFSWHTYMAQCSKGGAKVKIKVFKFPCSKGRITLEKG